MESHGENGNGDQTGWLRRGGERSTLAGGCENLGWDTICPSRASNGASYRGRRWDLRRKSSCYSDKPAFEMDSVPSASEINCSMF